MRFRSVVELGGKTATGIPVPPDVIAELGSGRRPAVRVTLGGHTYRSTVATRGGASRVPLSAENRERAGVAAGDSISVELEVDTAPREVVVPPALAEALDADGDARRFFESLSYSQQRWYVLPIEDAKTEETRERRVAKALAMLREGRKR